MNATPFATPTALIVDDDPATVEILSRMFRLDGYRVFGAHDVETGLEEANRSLPHIILLDLHMPNLDGLAFLRLLRVRDRREMPVTILTGDHLIDEGVLGEIRKLGASIRFKPFTLSDMADLVEGRTCPTFRPALSLSRS